TTANGWLGLGLIGLGLNSLLTWDMHVVHHQSYLSMALLFFGLFAPILGLRPGARRVYLALHVTWWLVIWVWSPFLDASIRLDHLIGFGLAGLTLTAFLIGWQQRLDISGHERGVAAGHCAH
ncbi:MAG: hypothetical protein KDC98_23840, partial [Planctomycetes bacterium]|nr:hypothetical protein [Planctomycetota bacterium]